MRMSQLLERDILLAYECHCADKRGLLSANSCLRRYGDITVDALQQRMFCARCFNFTQQRRRFKLSCHWPLPASDGRSINQRYGYVGCFAPHRPDGRRRGPRRRGGR